ncbi:sentrin-specific protease 2 isoform X2 [Stegastes partitus]|uniref:Sentrin-specific protease 2 isoform X2 n=1 Tax=Stegastes partitus TaxID=144197 RepID=A0A9Y4JGJ0_9TELE|nr:PREDICTED: sentrin-specific protease 2-like isoform X2 [Stegastes partitus]
MYGWIVDGISSLFEPISGQNPTEWPGKGNVSQEEPTRPGVRAAARRQESNGRPAKRNYQSVHVPDGVCQTDQVEVKRRRRDVVISFVKKTVAGVAGLLGLRKPLSTKCEKPRQCEETQPVILMGIDELQTSWLNSAEWRMDKPAGGVNERGGKNPYQSSSLPLMRKYSGTALSAGLPDRGKDREWRGSLQLLPSRPTLRVGNASSDPTCNGFGHNRNYKPSLTVEEAIKQNNKEHYRRLVEMVTEKYSKSQPLPFNQTKPQDESLSHVDHKTAASGNTFESVPRKTGYTAVPNVFTWRNASATKDRWGGLTFSKSFSGAFEDKQPVRCTKKQAAEVDLSTEVATRLKLVDRDTPAVSLPETHSAHTWHSEEDIPRLTKEMVVEVSGALAQSDPNLVLSAAFKLRITQRDLATLQEGGWLNDEVMNFYLSLVMERCSGEAGRFKVYSFSTFFFPKLRGGGGGGGGQVGGHAAVKRWTKAVDLFLFDLILVPLHLGVHWAMAVIDFTSKTVKSYDSMGQRHDDICSLLLLYLKEEHKAKKGRELDCAKWTVGSLRAGEIPQQKNGSDCGVFACKYADFIAKGRPLTFKQCHMPLFRKLMMWEILNQKLL